MVALALEHRPLEAHTPAVQPDSVSEIVTSSSSSVWFREMGCLDCGPASYLPWMFPLPSKGSSLLQLKWKEWSYNKILIDQMLSSPCLSAKNGLGAAANRSLLLSAKGLYHMVEPYCGCFSFYGGWTSFIRCLFRQQTSVVNLRIFNVNKYY